MVNVLYISYDGMTDPLGQSQVLPYLAGLSNENKYYLISFEKSDAFEKNKEIIEKICKQYNIEWFPLSYTKRPKVLSTVYDVFKMFRQAKKIDKEFGFEVVHCRSYISSLVGLSFKRKRNKKFIFDMRGFWADERVEGDLWNLKNPIYKSVYTYFKNKERAYLEHADAVVSLTENGKKEMLTWNVPQLVEENISVIPCAADYSLFEINTPEKKAKSKQNLGLSPNQKVISYLGSIGTWYLVEEMILFFAHFKKKYTNAKFLFLTGGNPNIIYDLGKKHGLTKDDFIIAFAKRNEITSYIHASDASLIFIKPSYSKKSSSPTKMGELLAMGVPVICNTNVGDVDLIMEKINVGYSLPSFEEEEIMKCVNQFEELTEISPESIREQSKSIFLLETNVEKYRSIYHRIND